jgi:hypothetical protein
MITIVPYFLTVLMLAIFIKRRHQQYVERKYKFRMHKLRDELRRLGATGVLDPSSPMFEYYDDSFSKNIQQSYYLTLPGMAYIYYKHKNDPLIAQHISFVTTEVKKIPELVKLKEQASKATFNYVIQQEVLFHLGYVIVLMVFKFRGLKTRVKKLIDSVYWMPETSGMQHATC